MFSKSMKLFILTLLIFILTLGAVALGQNTESVTAPTPLPVPRVVKDRQFVLGFQVPYLTAESQQRILLHTQIECEKRGWKLIANTDALTVDLERAGIENLINQDVDAIITFTGTPSTWEDLIIKAREKGIGFYCVDTAIRNGIIINTTQPNGVVGAKMVYYGVDKLLERGNVLILQIDRAVVYRQRSAVAKGLLETEWPALKMVGYEVLPTQGYTKAAFDVTQNYLTKLNNDLQWVVCPSDVPAMTVARAIEEAGLTKDNCFATGIDGGTNSYAEIRKGTPFVATFSQPFELYTHRVFEIITQVQLEGIAPGAPDSMIPRSRTIYDEGVVTSEVNVLPVGAKIHEQFGATYYDPNDKEAWYFWGEPYTIK